MIKNSFALRILVINFLLLALPLLIDSFIFFQKSYVEAIQSAKKQLADVTNLRSFSLVTSEHGRQMLLNEIKYVLDISENIASQNFDVLSRALAQVAQTWGHFHITVMTTGHEGDYKIVASSKMDTVGTFFHSYKQLDSVLREGSKTFVLYVYEPDYQEYVPYLFVAQTIEAKNTGQVVGILMIASEITDQFNIILAPDPQMKDAQFAILNPDSVVFKATDRQLIGNYFRPISLKRRSELISMGQLGDLQLSLYPLPVFNENHSSFEFIFNNQLQIAYCATNPEFRLSVIGYLPKEQFFIASIGQFLFVYTTYGLLLIVGGAITYWLALWIARPLRQLTHVMGEMSQGNLDVRFQPGPYGFEINILGCMFNETVEALLQNIQRAEEEKVKKQIFQRELAIGRQIQRSLLLARIPVIQGATVAGTFLPAREVGGDFYMLQPKYVQQPEETLILGVADVPGRGISSCLYALSVRNFLSTYATLFDEVDQIFGPANHAFVRDTKDSGIFATIFFASFHTQSRMFSYYCAGHIPGIVRRSNGQMIALTHAGEAMGLQPTEKRFPDNIQLYPNDTVVLFTTGLIELQNAQHEKFSRQRLEQIIQNNVGASAQEVVDTLQGHIQAFTAGIPQEEEVIIVALKVD
jgi:serine phosphatase RsbU (regulator of sigma subunit)